MTTQLAIRLEDDDLHVLDELAKRDGVTRSEAARRAIRLVAGNTNIGRHRAELDRVGALLGLTPGTSWLTGDEVVARAEDPDFAADIASVIGDDSTDDMIDPWNR
jgi:predicted transcriptional regulator